MNVTPAEFKEIWETCNRRDFDPGFTNEDFYCHMSVRYGCERFTTYKLVVHRVPAIPTEGIPRFA